MHCANGNYDSRNICGLYDDVDFTANQMCCDCGGGFNGIKARSTKNGTRPLRIVTTTQEMDSWIHMVKHVHILIYDDHSCAGTTTPTLPLLKCVVLAEAEIREFARTRTTEPRTVTDNLV